MPARLSKQIQLCMIGMLFQGSGRWHSLRIQKGNQRGQMAIFVALIFQVLFIFFAMAINIGLVVHDKINLQNAVDLSAYYAGQKQAEILNVIAHTNYQIRQSWKLLNWRYYVMGTLGRNDHPSQPNSQIPSSEVPYANVMQSPLFCVSNSEMLLNLSSPRGANACKTGNFSFRNVTIPPVIAGFAFINVFFNQYARNVNLRIQDSCKGYSGFNWFMANSAYVAYILDQQNRKELIRALAKNLALPPDKMLDINGDSILEGAKKTFLKNLTASNRASFGEKDFIMYNSLVNKRQSEWLREMDVWYTMFYQDLEGSATSCTTSSKDIGTRPTMGLDQLRIDMGLSDFSDFESREQLIQQAWGAPEGNSIRLSMGVEKNPWVWAYMGVQARTSPRPLFFPFGDPVKFVARAFAQPFGGRIGPWYGRAWAPGAAKSSGDKMQLAPDAPINQGRITNEFNSVLPQYSRYPGDNLGLKSVFAQRGLQGEQGIRFNAYDYFGVTASFGPNSTNDILAGESSGSNIRRFEIGAISPDLFDIAYYSIQPNYGERYLRPLLRAKDKLGLPDIAYPRGDLGSFGNTEPKNLFSVKDQMNVALGIQQSVAPVLEPTAYWFVRAREHLLTSWVHNDVYGEYEDFPARRFGRCNEFDDKVKIKAPGSCLDSGGRTGYSVRIISPDLFKAELPLGGEDQTKAAMLNPPPEAW